MADTTPATIGSADLAELTAAAAESFPDEVVTSAQVRTFELPRGAGRFALVTLDNGHDHTKPTTFGPRGLLNLNTALDRVAALAEAGEITGAGVTGKPFVFAVGADLKGVGVLRSREQVAAVGRTGHAVFRRLRDLPVPSFAFYNGAAMGGGVEIGLNCDYRTVSAGVPAFSLPECFLGLVPAWGGCTLLPNLIGPERAVKVIIENALNQNRQLRGPQVFDLGIADAVFEPADFLARSLDWAAGVITGEIEVPRPEIDRGTAWDAAVAKGRAVADARVHGAAPAPYRALELIAAAKNRPIGDAAAVQAGFDEEDEALADLVTGPELKAGLYAFDLVQRRAKRPAGAPDKSAARPVTKVGVVGAGLMASQLALLFVHRLRVPVVLTDVDTARLEQGVGQVHAGIDQLAAKGRIDADTASRYRGLVSGSADKAGFADADLVIEAVFEELSVKQQVFAELEAVVSESCVLATNTSSLSITEMAGKLAHPERVVGFHFFNPVAVLPLLEIVRGEHTDEATLATAFATAKQLKKSAVLVKDAPAFVVNRVLTRFMGEVLGAVDAGTPVAVADEALSPLGLPLTPVQLVDLVGPAVAHHVAGTLATAYPERFTQSPTLARLVASGKRAFYRPGTTELDPEVAALLPSDGDPLTTDQVRERALRALAEEIHLMLQEGVVASPKDIDLCLLLGAGWPFHLGGITPYLDRTGISTTVNGRTFTGS